MENFCGCILINNATCRRKPPYSLNGLGAYRGRWWGCNWRERGLEGVNQFLQDISGSGKLGIHKVSSGFLALGDSWYILGRCPGEHRDNWRSGLRRRESLW